MARYKHPHGQALFLTSPMYGVDDAAGWAIDVKLSDRITGPLNGLTAELVEKPEDTATPWHVNLVADAAAAAQWPKRLLSLRFVLTNAEGNLVAHASDTLEIV